MGLFIMPVTSAIDLIIYGLDKRVIDVNSWLAEFHSSRPVEKNETQLANYLRQLLVYLIHK